MNIKEIKKLVYQIVKEEIKEYQVPVEILPLTSIENIVEIILTNLKVYLKEKESLIYTLECIKSELYINKTNDAYYNYVSNKLKILIKNNKGTNDIHFIWKLIKNIYHEYKHAILEKLVKKPSIETVEDLIYSIENIIDPTDDYYRTYHDDFFEEIQANNYGIKKAEQFLKNNKHYQETYQKLKNIIELDKLLHEIYYRNYSFGLILVKVNQDIKDNIRELNTYQDDKHLEIVRTLYDKKGKFKSLKELFQTNNWNLLSQEAQYLIIGSESYLDDFDYQNATKEELYLILDALSYILTLEYEKPKYNQEFRKKLELISRTLTDEDLFVINLYMDALLVLNIKEESNQIRINQIQNMINTIIELIKNKNNKYTHKKINTK